MSDRILSIKEIQELIAPIADKNNLKSVYLFGSYGRNEEDEKSDIDILFTTKEKVPGLIFICDLKSDFSKVLGKNVDIFFVKDINNSK